jgi:transposase
MSSSWVGACPGDDESAGVNYSHRSPQGNRHLRRLLNQSANAAARTKGSIFEIVYRRSVPRLGHNQAIGAIAHRQCRLIWLILYRGVRYEERGPAVAKRTKQKRTARMIRQLRSLGYQVELMNASHTPRRPRLRLDAETYKQLRYQVLTRDAWRCQCCGSTQNLDVHHLRFRSKLGDDSPENLITLCAVCHRRQHRTVT